MSSDCDQAGGDEGGRPDDVRDEGGGQEAKDAKAGAEAVFKKPPTFSMPLAKKAEKPLAPAAAFASVADEPLKATKPAAVGGVDDAAAAAAAAAAGSGDSAKPATEAAAYTAPDWGGSCREEYSLAVLKNGVEVCCLPLVGKGCQLVGRLPSNDIRCDHPSLSRHHAALQYSDGERDSRYERGWYVLDLGSTHGTIVNKLRLQPGRYRRLYVGHVIKFAASTRLFVLNGPEGDREPESSLTYTQLKERRDQRRRAREEAAAEAPAPESDGCAWGFGEDAGKDEEESAENPYAQVEELTHEAAYQPDPKKYLRAWYDREGLEPPEFQFVEAQFGKHHCRLELPVDGADGRPLVAEAIVGGKRRDAVAECALEACRLLDRLGELDDDRAGSGSAARRRRLQRLADNDYYDSDEDTFLDRTGQLEGKRRARMVRAGVKEAAPKAETFDELQRQHADLQRSIEELEAKLQAAADAQRQQKQLASGGNELDALEEYMRSVRSGGVDRSTRVQLRLELMQLRKEAALVERKMNKARPADLSSVGVATARLQQQRQQQQQKQKQQAMHEFVEEFDEDDNEDDKDNGGDNNAALAGEADAASEPKIQDEADAASEPGAQKEKPPAASSASAPSEAAAKRPSLRLRRPVHGPLLPPDWLDKEDKEDKEGKEDSVAKATAPSPPNVDEVSVAKATEEQQSVAKATVQQSVAKATVQQSVAKATVQQQVAKATVQRPVAKATVQQPVAKATEQEAQSQPSESPVAKRRRRGPQVVTKDASDDYDERDPSYALWLPPDDQTGDGSTKLNKQLGY